MTSNTNNGVSVSSNTFYPEKIIFCIDISGEMNHILEFNDLQYPTYNNVESEFQAQKLSVPNSPNGSPIASPNLPPRVLPQSQKPNNDIDLINLYNDFNVMNINNNNNNNNQINNNKAHMNSNSATNNYNDNSNNNSNNNNNNNNIDSNDKSGNLKGLANSAKKKLLKRGEKEDSDNLATGSTDNRKKSNSSLNFLKSSYSNVVQNVFSGNHSRASSSNSINNLTSVPLNNDFPALKQPIEITRLEAVKHYIKRFVSLKGSLCNDHQYAVVLLGVDAIWYNDFTSDYKNMLNVMDEIPAQEELIRNFGKIQISTLIIIVLLKYDKIKDKKIN